MDQGVAERGIRPQTAQNPDPTQDDDLKVIREQTRESVALLRQIVELLLPRVDPNKPKFEDLLNALVAQQARTLLIVQQISTDLSGLINHIAPEGENKPDGHRGGNGGLRS